MLFCGKESRFGIGDSIEYDGVEYVVDDMGILGSKLGTWRFVYFIRDSDGNLKEVIENEKLTRK